MTITVLITISPKPGKEPRIREILAGLVEDIKKHEQETSSYHVYHAKNDFLVIAKMKDESYMKKRTELKHHKDIARWIKEEDLLTQPLKYELLEDVDGFERNSKGEIVIGS